MKFRATRLRVRSAPQPLTQIKVYFNILSLISVFSSVLFPAFLFLWAFSFAIVIYFWVVQSWKTHLCLQKWQWGHWEPPKCRSAFDRSHCLLSCEETTNIFYKFWCFCFRLFSKEISFNKLKLFKIGGVKYNYKSTLKKVNYDKVKICIRMNSYSSILKDSKMSIFLLFLKRS